MSSNDVNAKASGSKESPGLSRQEKRSKYLAEQRAREAKKSAQGQSKGTAQRQVTAHNAPQAPRASNLASHTTFASAVTLGPVFRPGSYPVVFDAGSSTASAEIHFCLDGRKVINVPLLVHAAIKPTTSYVRYRAEAEVDVGRSIVKGIISTGILAIGQSVITTRETLSRPAGGFSALKSSEFVTLRSIRIAASQFGEFKLDSVGTSFVLSCFESEMRMIIRMARDVSSIPSAMGFENAVTRIAARSWIMTSAFDRRTMFIMAIKLSSSVKTIMHGLMCTAKEILNCFVSQQSPEWYPMYLSRLAWADSEAFADLFTGNWFDTAEHFVSLFAGPDGLSRLTILGLEWSAPHTDHLCLNLNWNQEVSNILGAWSLMAEPLKKFFQSESFSGYRRSYGSPDQLSDVEVNPPVTIVRGFFEAGGHSQSLAAAFPCRCHYDADRLPRFVVKASTIVTAEARNMYVLRDVL